MRHAFTILALCAALFAAGCACNSPAPAGPPGASPEALDLQPVVNQPVRGVCLEIPLIGCKLCIGVDCNVPSPITPAVFGQPVAAPRAPAAADDPCAEPPAAAFDPCAYAEPWEPAPAYGSASDPEADYRPVIWPDDLGTPPALLR